MGCLWYRVTSLLSVGAPTPRFWHLQLTDLVAVIVEQDEADRRFGRVVVDDNVLAIGKPDNRGSCSHGSVVRAGDDGGRLGRRGGIDGDVAVTLACSRFDEPQVDRHVYRLRVGRELAHGLG